MRPVIAIEPVADLWAHIAQQKRLVERVLAPFRVGGGDLVASVVARAEVVVQFGAKFGGDGGVFDEDGVFPVGVVGVEGGGGDVLGDPVGVAGAAVEGGGCAQGGVDVVDGAGKSVLEDAVRVDRRDDLFEGGGPRAGEGR